MEKILLLITSFFLLVPNGLAVEVELDRCIDGDTAKFIIDEEIKTARFLAIDTPESVHPTKEEEPYGKEASEYTCNLLTNANKIELEYDGNSDKTDKYDRLLVWVFVDNKMLQSDLVKNGYAKIEYVYGDYKYLNDLYKDEEYAKTNKLRIWGEYNEETNYIQIIILALGIVAIIFIPKYRNKFLKKLK